MMWKVLRLSCSHQFKIEVIDKRGVVLQTIHADGKKDLNKKVKELTESYENNIGYEIMVTHIVERLVNK